MNNNRTILSQLNMYPIKSARGISLTSSIVEERGLQFDRRWMLVNEHNKFLTQREYPRMALISPSITKKELLVKAPFMQTLSIPLLVEHHSLSTVTIWDDSVQVVRVSNEADEWFSAFLKVNCKLVFFPNESIRRVDTTYAHNNERTAFADAFPFLLISEASLEMLNSKLAEPVPMNRFRPNIVVHGCEPFAEDRWKTIRINNIIFHPVKPCSRCVVTTTNQLTAERRSSEPLATLATFRTINNKVMFGQNVVAEKTGSISVGDTIEILEMK